jgi:hypothetical protein
MGLTWQCSLAGLTKKFRKGGRFGERLITLAPPHVGTAEQRIAWNFDAWPHFLKRLHEWTREKYGSETTRFTLSEEGAEPVENDVRTFELCHHARFWEVTSGADGEGHPHFHVWHWGPYIEQALLESWWREAWERASGHRVPENRNGERRIMVDVRAVIGDEVEVRDEQGRPIVDEHGRVKTTRLDRELVKYLTKDVDLPPHLMARIYGELLGRRARPRAPPV